MIHVHLQTYEKDLAFLRALAATLPGAEVQIPERVLGFDDRLSLVLGDHKWHWDYLQGMPTTQHHVDMTPLGALSGSDMVPLPALRLLWSDEASRRAVYAALYHGGKPRTSETWQIWPRLWLGRTPEPGEHLDHDIVMRLAIPLAPGVTCRRVVLDYPFEDSEDDVHQEAAIDIAAGMSHLLAERWHAGDSIRIGCLAGMNRSALVLGAVLCRLGMTGEEAVAQIRWKRGKWALSNARFHRWLVEDFGPRMAAERQAKEPPL